MSAAEAKAAARDQARAVHHVGVFWHAAVGADPETRLSQTLLASLAANAEETVCSVGGLSRDDGRGLVAKTFGYLTQAEAEAFIAGALYALREVAS